MSGTERAQLRIRPEQVATLRASMYQDAVIEHLREIAPRWCRRRDDVELREWAAARVEHAFACGLVAEWDVLRFAAFELELGPGFTARHAWAKDILALAHLSPTERVDLLEHFAKNHLSDPEPGPREAPR